MATQKSATTKQLVAEFVATTLFVWIGTGAAVSSAFFTPGDGVDPGRLLTIAIAFGFGIAVLAYGIGDISGGHINPAVTFAFMGLGKMSPVAGLMYMAAQFLGAIFGSFILWGCVSGLTDVCPSEDTAGVCEASYVGDVMGDDFGPAYKLGINTVESRITLGGAFLFELMGTYLLVITVLNSAVSSKSTAGNAAPMAIGWAVMLSHILLVPFTGCGINPARSLGPMIVASIGGLGSAVWIRGWWVYYVAPWVGSALAVATYAFVFDSDQEKEAAKEEAAADEPAEINA